MHFFQQCSSVFNISISDHPRLIELLKKGLDMWRGDFFNPSLKFTHTGSRT
jgi:hypothetical protein